MSASKFFRNFLTLPQMGSKDNSCHQTRVKGHQNYDLKVQKTRAIPAPDVKCNREFQFAVSIDHGSEQRQKKVSEDAPTTDLNQTLNRENGKRELHLNFRVVGTAVAKDIDRNFCGTEENRRDQVDTVTSNRLTCSSGREKEIEIESTAECGQTNLPDIEIHTSVVCPVAFTSLQAMADGSLKNMETEKEVVAPTDLFDKLFQDYVNKLNVTAKANDLEESLRAACLNPEQQEDLYVPLVDISIRETRKRHYDINRVPECAWQEEFPFKTRRFMNNDEYSMIMATTAEHLSQPIEIDGQHKTNYENIATSAIDNDRGDVEPSTESQSEKIKYAFIKIGCEAVSISDDECSSIASSNSEIYKEADCEDVEIHEEQTQKVLIKRNANNFVASTDVRFQFSSQVKLNKNNKAPEKTTQELVLSLNNSTAPVDKLLDNSVHVKTNNLPFLEELEDLTLQEVLSLSTDSSKSATTNSDSQLMSCSRSELQRSSDNLHNKVLSKTKLAIMRESRISKDKENPALCGYCGKFYPKKWILFAHIIQQHVEKHRYSCEVCCKSFGDQYHLSQPLTSHTQEAPFTCDQCGMRFQLKSDICRHNFMHTEDKLFSCNICNKSYTSSADLFGHSKVHKEEEYREDVTCNICKKVFGLPSSLKQHMMIHSDENPLKLSLCDKQFNLKTGLLNHLSSSNDELIDGIVRSDSFSNKDVSECEVAIVGESQIKNTMKTKYQGSDQCQKKVSKDAPTTDLNQNLNQEHYMQDLHLNCRVVGTAVAKDIDRNFCGTEENRRDQVDTVTSNRPTCSSGRENEIKNESTAECGQTNLPDIEIHTSVVCPVAFTSQQAVADGSLKDMETEEEVVAPTDIFDKLFQDYVNKLNVTAKANDLEVVISDDDDDCISIASSSNTEIFEVLVADCQEIEI